MSRLFRASLCAFAALCAGAVLAPSPAPAAGDTAGSKVSPLPAPDASTQPGQGGQQGGNQPAPPPSTSKYMQTETDTGTQTGSTTVPGSPVSPVPAPDASTAGAQERQNNDMAVGAHHGGGITEHK
jgi:hypothetical protein